MIEDMRIRKLAPKTQQGYIRTIKNFAVFLGRSPDTASFEDVQRPFPVLPCRALTICLSSATAECARMANVAQSLISCSSRHREVRARRGRARRAMPRPLGLVGPGTETSRFPCRPNQARMTAGVSSGSGRPGADVSAEPAGAGAQNAPAWAGGRIEPCWRGLRGRVRHGYRPDVCACV